MLKKTPPDHHPITLTIDKLIHGGAGLARHAGKACFIESVLPGETVRAVITEQRSQFFTASLIAVLEPSPARIEPPCPVAGLCGGCQWQHIAYSRQLSCKTAIVADCLKRIGKIHHHEPSPATPSPLATRYRSRAAFKISGGRRPKIGFYQNKTHAVVEIHECLLLEQKLQEALQICRRLLREERKYAGHTDLNLLTVDGTPLVLGLWHDRAQGRHIKCAVNTATGTTEQFDEPLQETLSGMQFLRSADNFYQVNRLQNQALIDKVLAFFKPASDCAILDMFCGCGNFSLFLAEKGAAVTGLDASAAAISEARQNAGINGIKNAAFITANIHRLDESLLRETYDGVLLNPPRSGCEARTLKMVAAKKPQNIVYVSCNPATLARDLRYLLDTGYAVDVMQPFDMFPQTYHIETVVKLSRQPQEGQ